MVTRNSNLSSSILTSIKGTKSYAQLLGVLESLTIHEEIAALFLKCGTDSSEVIVLVCFDVGMGSKLAVSSSQYQKSEQLK